MENATQTNGRVVLISGGTYGIGRAAALLFAGQGCRVTAFGVDPDQSDGLCTVAAERGLLVTVHTADIADRAAVERVVDDVIARTGQIDVLVNNAAVRPVGALLDTTDADWDRAFAVNIRGMFLLTRAVLPHMLARGHGAIVNTASGAGYGKPGIFAYSVSKGAVFPFTMALALDYASHGIRVNAVLPGSTLTGMTENWGPGVIERAKSHSAAGRINMPEDVANAIVWLASDAAATISGATLEVGTLPRLPA